MVFIIGMISMINAEVQINQLSSISTDHHIAIMTTNYLFDDSSSQGVGNFNPLPLSIDVRMIGSLPMGLAGLNETFHVDSCNMTINHNLNNYTWVNTLGYIWNSRSFFINASQNWSSGSVHYFADFNVYNQDTVQVIFSCHSSDNNFTSSMTDLLDFMSVSMGQPAFSCNQCNGHTFQESVNYQNTNSIYDNIQTAINWNWEIWLIIEWIVRILFIFICIALIFAGVYWIYVFIKNLENDISKK